MEIAALMEKTMLSIFNAEEKKIAWKYCRMAMFCGRRHDMICLAVTLLQQKIVAENCFIKEAA